MFWHLWASSVFSQLGWTVQTVAAGWMMTTLTDSRTMVALVQTCIMMPVMLFSIPMGVLADGFDRRRMMIVAQILMMVGSVVLVLTSYAGLTTPPLLLILSFLIAVGVAIHNPAWQASFFDLVGKPDVPAAVTLHSMGYNAMRSLGPAIGGLIVALASVTAAFAVNAISYIPLIVALFRWKPAPVERSLPREGFRQALVSGLRYVAMSPNLLIVMLRATLFGGAATSLTALMPLVASEWLGGGAILYGTLLGSFGAGAVVGGMITPVLRAHLSNETATRIACLGSAIPMLVLAFHHNAWTNHLFLLPAGASWVFAVSMFNVSFQLAVPRWVLARALSIYQTCLFGGLALGSWLWGIVANDYGLWAALVGSALMLLANAVLGLVLPCPDFSEDDLDPLQDASLQKTSLPVAAGSGPIQISVEFHILEKDIPALLALMVARRRIRRRDGALNWHLSRNVHEPEMWIETYRVPDWSAYLRHTARRTKADADNLGQLLKLHQGDEPPRVSRYLIVDPRPRRARGLTAPSMEV
jgi:MFS family permease